MESKIKELIREKYLDYRVISIGAMKEKYVGFTHKHLKECDGFSIWGVFSTKLKLGISVKREAVCLYTQDSKAKIKFYDPVNETLKAIKNDEFQ